MTGSAAAKESLLKRLAEILDVGDEDNDYVTDVLDQLVEIAEDVDDVTSYLTSFLGGDDDADGNNLMQFANDVRRFKFGEEMIIKTVDSSTTKSDTAVGVGNPPKQEQRKEQKKQKKKQEPIREIRSVEHASAASVQASETKVEVAVQSNNGPPSTQINHQACSSTIQEDPPKRVAMKQQIPPKELKKGKAKKICGCFGTKHKPLTNCLHCGRISCQAEGYDFCPFCHILIEDFSKRIRSGDASSSALLHKERLLEFDRTAASRTHILDDQEDYFVTSNSMWSTQKEQDDAREKEEERRKMLHERQKQTMAFNA
eukprot:scaffold18376_cov160-Skeletonema_menzelii.AAC.10